MSVRWMAASIVVSALGVGLQLALSGTSPANLAVPAMGGVHMLIGVGEGLITVGAVSFLRATRRDLIDQSAAPVTGGRAVHATAAVTSSTPMPVALWEAYREGYDDYRYVFTLQQLIATAKASPRAGVSIQVPSLGWTVRGFYGRFYQGPPLLTASGPLLAFVTSQNLALIPLRGERDEEFQAGVIVPVRGWTLDADVFRTKATNFFDHNSVGNSNVFFPLTIDVEERMYAAGRIPGSFFRREGRPSETAILTCRLTDRPLRPTFKDGFRDEVQVVVTVLSVDHANPYDVIAINGASLAVMIAGLPFDGPVGAVRMGLIGTEWKANPTFQELDEATFDVVVAGRRNDLLEAVPLELERVLVHALAIRAEVVARAENGAGRHALEAVEARGGAAVQRDPEHRQDRPYSNWRECPGSLSVM